MKIKKDKVAFELINKIQGMGFTIAPYKQTQIKKLSLVEMAILEDSFNMWLCLTTVNISSEIQNRFNMLNANLDMGLMSLGNIKNSIYDLYQELKAIKGHFEYQQYWVLRRTV